MGKWKEIIEYQQRRIEENLGKEKIKGKFRFVACEDMENKSWFFVDAENGATMTIPFGGAAIDLLNSLIVATSNNPYYNESCDKLASAGFSKEDIEDFIGSNNYNEKYIKNLVSFIVDIPELKKNISEAQFKMLVAKVWHQYRDCDTPDLFREYIELIEEGHSRYANTELQQNREVKEQTVCVYHDTDFFMNEKGDPVIGRIFVLLEKYEYAAIFRWDLLHLLQGTAEKTMVCENCGQLYQSNKNTAKYCKKCRESRIARNNQKLKNNPCRHKHSQVLSKLHNYKNLKAYKEDFRIESNYYWAVVNGNEPKEIPKTFDSNIKTEQQYLEWLETIFKKPQEALKDRY